ncbi:hypothetical protein [Actinoplanes aureus]|uniref:Uncharacterized protein n=1 Tax=Actinoplanes aureus TaxID=2792083 RepID=A0A931G1U2_9ACTN|nr:hypothetical protein [Actinoplanes aureus]MBG0567027.1 hypothetical protein [Actinoplanes aureus]
MTAGPTRPAGTVLRLRPSVRASPTADGVHVRGWSAAFTVSGGPGLWLLWQRLEPALRLGVTPERLAAAAARPAPADAVRRLLRALAQHDMTVAVPAGWRTGDGTPSGPVADWLEQLAADPADAWRRLRGAVVRVSGADSGPAVAGAARSALAAAGVARSSGPGLAASRPGLVALTAGPVTVVAGAAGFVTYPMPPATAAATGDRIARRLAGAVPASTSVSGPLAAVLGGMAAERLLRAVAGLPDPGVQVDGWPSVLVARAEPLAAGFRPWLLDGPPHAGFPENDGDVDRTLRRMDALCDRDLGVLPAARYEDLPQIPAALAVCDLGGRSLLGTGATTGAARLDAVLRCAGRALDPHAAGRLAVGVDDRHAAGVLLRRVAYRVAGRAAVAAGVEDPGWRGDPTARRWWSALTAGYGAEAHGVVAQLAGGVFVARVEVYGRELAWAVEGGAGTAMAMAAQRAVAVRQGRLAGVGDGAETHAGASPGRIGEPELQDSLRRIVRPARWPRPARIRAGDLWTALHTTGFAVQETP